jgi:hypothetical protein
MPDLPGCAADRSRARRLMAGCPERDRSIALYCMWSPPAHLEGLGLCFGGSTASGYHGTRTYRLLQIQDLVTSPAYIVIKTVDEFHDKTTTPNPMAPIQLERLI